MTRYVHEVIEAAAAATPDAVAVRVGREHLTYRQLDARANRIAHHLRAAGVGPESVVGVLLRRGLDTLPCLLGIWKAGGSHLPLDTGLPAERLAYMLETAAARLIVTEDSLSDLLGPGYGGQFVRLDRDRALIADRPDTPPPAVLGGTPDTDPKDRIRRDRLAYTLFTSGSTGRPKGVQISQYALLNMLFSFGRRYASGPAHTWLASTSLSFDLSIAELYLALVSGGRVVLADDAQAADPVAQVRLIETAGITHVQGTPAGWKLLLAAGLGRSPIVAVTSGDACPVSLARELRSRVDRLHNQYGPTETTVWTTAWDVPPEPTGLLVGRPIPNIRAYVLDAAQQPVPVGVVGEIYHAGAGLARGYVGRPGLTAEKFLPEPFGGPPGSRMYRTGDLGRFHPDGQLECLGRIDRQVKIRGFRIEPAEIEERLLSHPAVRDAVVVDLADAAGERWLAAYVVPAAPGDGRAAAGSRSDGSPSDEALSDEALSDGSPSDEALSDEALSDGSHSGEALSDEALSDRLRSYLAESLPVYMVPAAFVPLPALPLNANGKVDRKALPAPGRTALVGDREYVAPRDRTERLLVEVCAEVLGVRGVGVRDRLRDLGADSMRIVDVMGGARRAGLPLTLRMLLDSETVEELARALGGEPGAEKNGRPRRTGETAEPATGAAAETATEPAAWSETGSAEPAAAARTGDESANDSADGSADESGTAAATPGAPAPTAATPGAPAPTPAANPASGGDWPAAPRVAEAMAAHHVPGAAVAVLSGGRLTGVYAFGVRSVATGEPVTSRTRFQAGSISKHVTAFAVLRLVARDVLDLDADIDGYLHGRVAPRGAYGLPVTLRHLLDNTAGFSSGPATWWRPGEAMPKLSDLLGDVRAEHNPGAVFHKSGSHWALTEQLLLDVTGQDFDELVSEQVFRPLGMADSSFLPPALPRPGLAEGPGRNATDGTDAADGHDEHGVPLPGGYRLRPVHAGSGLWSTPADLALLAVEIRRARLGLSDLLPADLAGHMLTEGLPGSFYGLGTVVDRSAAELEFGHGGQTAGFRALSSLRLGAGDGCVVMANSDNGKSVHHVVAALLGRDPSDPGR